MLSEKPSSPSIDNIWKYADAFISKERFVDILSSIDPYPRPVPTEPLPVPEAVLLETFEAIASPIPKVATDDDDDDDEKSMLVP